MPAPSTRLLQHRSFVRFWCARVSTNGAYMMQGVAVGWQVYDLTHDPLDLGLVGLVQFLPLVFTSVAAGQVLDLFDRRAVAVLCQLGKGLGALALAVGTARGVLTREAIFAILLFTGTARAFELPTMHALLPSVVPTMLLPRAIAASASAQQTALICGPSLGGVLYLAGPTFVYALCAAAFAVAFLLLASLERPPDKHARGPISVASLFAGFRYMRENKIVLGAITLDLVAVVLGGVTALLPIYARDILGAGPWALGLLRSAPAVGALATSLTLARRAIDSRAGAVMFAAVGIFGLATVAFALAQSIALSFLALVVYGASDAVSVVIRQSLIQLRTPSDRLGRVMAVNSLCTGSSGTLGEFRAGVIAASFGAVPAALVGGVGSIAVMFLWMWAFPQLRKVDRLSGEVPFR